MPYIPERKCDDEENRQCISLEKAGKMLDKTSDAIEKGQPSEYIEAYLHDAIQAMTEFVETHKFIEGRG